MKNLGLRIVNIKPSDLIIMLVWISNPLLDYFKIVLRHLPILSSVADMVVPLMFCSLIFMSAFFIKKVIHVTDILFYVTWAVIWMVHYICFPQNTTYMQECFSIFFCTVLPLYFVGVSMVNIKKILPYLEYLSYFTIVCYFIFKNIAVTDEQIIATGGDMVGAYALLPHLLLITWRALNRKQICRILIPIASFFILVMLGNRGSLLSYIFFIFVYFVLIKKIYKRLPVVILSIGLLLGIATLSDKILLFITIIITNMGYSTRILDKIQDNELLDSSGRDLIAERILSAIEEQPFVGHGITADRLICGTYSHNIFLEILVSFGCVIGSLLIFMLIYVMVRAYLETDDTVMRAFLLILFFSGFLQLIFSSSYLYSPNLFLLIGFSVLLAFRYKKYDRNWK